MIKDNERALGLRLKQLRKKHNFTQAGLAAKLQITQQAVGKWETGRSFPEPALIIRLASVFNVSTDYLLGQKELPEWDAIAPQPVMVPILGLVRAGYGNLAFEELLGYEPAYLPSAEGYFFLLVQGDSMEPRIKDGDLALIQRRNDLENGDLAVVIYGDGEASLKRFIRKGQAVVLQPFNPAYGSMVISGPELDDLHIIGKVRETKARW